MITKDKMESMCRDAGMVPEARSKISGREIFVADGFSPIPHIAFMKFGVKKDEFKDGAFCTLWFAAKGEDKLDLGLPLIFDKSHDPQIMGSARKHARINAAIRHAKSTIATFDKVKGAGLNA